MKRNHAIQTADKKIESPNVSRIILEKENLGYFLEKVNKQKIPLNLLVNDLLKDTREWILPSREVGFVSLPKILLVKIMDHLSEKQFIEIANYIAKEEVKKMMFVFKDEHSVKAVVDVIESWAKGSNFEFHAEKIDDNIQKMLIKHDMGPKWSKYYQQLFSEIFKDLLTDQIGIEITDDSLFIVLNFNEFHTDIE